MEYCEEKKKGEDVKYSSVWPQALLLTPDGDQYHRSVPAALGGISISKGTPATAEKLNRLEGFSIKGETCDLGRDGLYRTPRGLQTSALRRNDCEISAVYIRTRRTLFIPLTPARLHLFPMVQEARPSWYLKWDVRVSLVKQSHNLLYIALVGL